VWYYIFVVWHGACGKYFNERWMEEMKKIFSLFLALALLMTICFSAVAEETNPVIDPEDPAPISSSYNFWTSISGSWTTVLADGGGFNCNVRLTMLSGGAYCLAVRMLSGSTVVWQESPAISAYPYTRTFWCGSNVTAIQVRLVDINGNSISATDSLHVEAPV